MIILGSFLFAYDVVAKPRHRQTAVAVAHQRDQPVATRVLGDKDSPREDDD